MDNFGSLLSAITNNWALIATILWAISELCALSPTIAANGVFQLIHNYLEGLNLRGNVKPAEKGAIIESATVALPKPPDNGSGGNS